LVVSIARASVVAVITVALPACACSEASTPAATAVTTSAASSSRFVALGDSFTAGTGSMPAQAFPARLVARWGCPNGPELEDLGVNGFTSQQVIEVELGELRRFAPQVVTLAIGANDIVQGVDEPTYRAHVRKILAAVVAAGVTRIVTIPQPDWSKSPAAQAFGSPDALHASIVAENAVLAAETARVHGEYVDLFPLMERQAAAHMLARDGLHPSAAAYDEWAAALATQVAAPCAR
jgi:lysophospholipase L1-like esterase